MSPSAKILSAIVIVLLLGCLGFIVYQQHELKTQQVAIQTSLVAQQQLVDSIARSQETYATAAQLAQFASDNNINLQAIQANLKTLNSQLTAINVITVDSSGQTTTNVPSSGTGAANPNPSIATTVPCSPNGTATCPNQDPYGYQKAQQNLTLNEDFTNIQVPFGVVGFSAWNAAPWDTNILPREYNVHTVVGTDVNERQTFYNQFTVNVGGKTYDIPIKNATSEQQVPKASFTLWNPKLMLGADGGINITHIRGYFGPSINLGIASYGKFTSTPDWSIVQIGAGYDAVGKTAQFTLTPIAYNIGRNLFSPLMNNTYLGPTVSVSTDGSFGAGAGLRVGF